MAGRKKKRRKVRLTFAGVIVLDVLVFMFCTVLLVLLILSPTSGNRKAAAQSNETGAQIMGVASSKMLFPI